ncbi:MAG: thymidine phosphorylase [Clostridiales bacterium]|nr:thymidine phosphorylase [Clostridiales bacterium]
MNMLELIEKKRDGGVISKEEIQFFVDGVTDKSIPDYQVSAFLMAVLWRGMNDEETTDLTLAMANSGSICDLSDIPGVKVDKHSTGGVGDKVTPILLPIVASFGIPCVKLSGRGLGFTGGTIDKFESIEGFCTSVDPSEFKSKIENCGLLLGGQTADLAPCDKYLYALRDVTGTVPSIPLIASSIMSKKIAGGSDAIVLDITCGSGAFMKDIDSARELARRMISIGKLAGKPVSCVMSSMEQPLGIMVGNILEMQEAVEVLRGRGREDVKSVVLTMAAEMLKMTEVGKGKSEDELKELCNQKLQNGEAFEKFGELVLSQGGMLQSDGSPVYVDRPFEVMTVHAKKDGYISKCDALAVGEASCLLGAGRMEKDDVIDMGAGIRLYKKIGDKVSRGDELYTMYTGTKAPVGEDRIDEALYRMEDAYEISDSAVSAPKEILDVISFK